MLGVVQLQTIVRRPLKTTAFLPQQPRTNDGLT